MCPKSGLSEMKGKKGAAISELLASVRLPVRVSRALAIVSGWNTCAPPSVSRTGRRRDCCIRCDPRLLSLNEAIQRRSRFPKRTIPEGRLHWHRLRVMVRALPLADPRDANPRPHLRVDRQERSCDASIFIQYPRPRRRVRHTGIELPDLEAAQTHAFRLYATATGDDFMSPCQEWRMEVTDSVGTILFRLDLTSAAQSVGFN